MKNDPRSDEWKHPDGHDPCEEEVSSNRETVAAIVNGLDWDLGGSLSATRDTRAALIDAITALLDAKDAAERHHEQAWKDLQGMGVTRGVAAYVSEDFEDGYARGIGAARHTFREALAASRERGGKA